MIDVHVTFDWGAIAGWGKRLVPTPIKQFGGRRFYRNRRPHMKRIKKKEERKRGKHPEKLLFWWYFTIK